MNRHEIAAILGEYSRQGFSAQYEGAINRFFLHARGEYRTVKEARRDTGVNFERAPSFSARQWGQMSTSLVRVE
jgi:hypothetical protein